MKTKNVKGQLYRQQIRELRFLLTDCNYQKSGPTSYNEYVPEIGAWVTNNCAAGKFYSHPHCTCVDKGI